MNSKIAIYPGSFDPITHGHLDIIERASKIFDKVIVCVMYNNTKKYLFSLEERANLIRECVNSLENVEVDCFDGLLVEYARQKDTNIIVKGLRAFIDFEYEFQMALTNKHLDNDIETFFMVTNNKHSYISSSLVKELVKLNGDVEGFIPENVKNAMQKKFEEGCI
ncbi:pantetheine-phosphate adenylyltransferase [Eubacteriaceae bacterium ES3]|nr:pantetheine-phosphate adenylyltransferase [Eubacteriaceae bacterium ES3]